MRRLVVACCAVLAGATPATAAVAPPYSVSPITNLSASCAGQNAEVEQATDPKLGYVYDVWMGCNGIAFARSTDGGLSFEKPLSVPGSIGSNVNAWDPAVAVAPDGTVYAVFMIAKASQWYPIVAASVDHGATFAQVTSLVPPAAKNWGGRRFIAVGADGAVYVTRDYGPERTSVTYVCAANGRCAFAAGDVHAVVPRSAEGGRALGLMVLISPGFPA